MRVDVAGDFLRLRQKPHQRLLGRCRTTTVQPGVGLEARVEGAGEPLAPVVVELEEGVRLLTNLVNVAPQDLVMDMPVEVEFRAVTDTVTLPLFRAV